MYLSTSVSSHGSLCTCIRIAVIILSHILYGFVYSILVAFNTFPWGFTPRFRMETCAHLTLILLHSYDALHEQVMNLIHATAVRVVCMCARVWRR
jgi:hypothetical protein